jgi:hypothetical protein
MTALLFQAAEHIPGRPPSTPAEPVIATAFTVATALMLWHCGRSESRIATG